MKGGWLIKLPLLFLSERESVRVWEWVSEREWGKVQCCYSSPLPAFKRLWWCSTNTGVSCPTYQHCVFPTPQRPQWWTITNNPCIYLQEVHVDPKPRKIQPHQTGPAQALQPTLGAKGRAIDGLTLRTMDTWLYLGYGRNCNFYAIFFQEAFLQKLPYCNLISNLCKLSLTIITL